ncbi:hypothetical protein N8148_03050 [Gammaproteobacteria bacterium]|nr:hypothetical protein [Gammaproteobacteria bacterium]
MDLTKLTDAELADAFKEASANKESLNPFVQEKQKRMNAPKVQDVPEIIDPGEEGICLSCE